MPESESQDPRSQLPDWLVAVLLTEVAALLIALVTPITPSRTGSTWSPAEWFTADPSYLEKVLSSFVMVNLMIAVLALVAWVFVRRKGSDE